MYTYIYIYIYIYGKHADKSRVVREGHKVVHTHTHTHTHTHAHMTHTHTHTRTHTYTHTHTHTYTHTHTHTHDTHATQRRNSRRGTQVGALQENTDATSATRTRRQNLHVAVCRSVLQCVTMLCSVL